MEHRRVVDAETEQTAAERTENHDGKMNGRHARPDAEPGQIGGVRATDIEPYTGLRYLSKLFRFMAVILLLLLVAEIVTGIYTQGAAAVATLLGEASRLIVLAGVLWGTGDLAHLLIDVGHDVRAARILLARQVHRTTRGSAAADAPVVMGARDREVPHSATGSSAPPPIP